MAVDPYAMCPCGSGKKLKFCCADIAAELEKIHTMIDGDQPRAALRHVEQALARRPGRESLLDLKISIELTLEEADAAAETAEEFIRVSPENPAAYAQRAIVAAVREGGRAAVVPLQQAIALIEKDLPRQVRGAIGTVGQALLMEGDVLAARAHLWLHHGVSEADDRTALSMLARLGQVRELPLLLRDHLYMKHAPEGHPAQVDHDRAQWYASSGRWMPAAQALDALCGLHPEEPTFAYNRGLVFGWLGHTRRFVTGMHDYARLVGPDNEDAVEAEALAQLLDPELREEPLDVLQVEHAVADEDGLLQRLARDRRVVALPINPDQPPPEEGPAPRGLYLLLDKPLPESGVAIDLDAVPSIVGMASFFGRQTDKPERLELIANRGEQLDRATDILREVAGPCLGEQRAEKRLGAADAVESAMGWRLHFPEDTPPARRREVLAEQRRRAISNRWPNTPRKALGGKTPAQAAGDPALRLVLQALVLLLEHNHDNRQQRQALGELRSKLRLPLHPPIDPASVDPAMLPLCRVPRLDLSRLSDEDLAQLYRRASLAGASDATLLACREAVTRPSLAEKLPVREAYQRILDLEPDPAVALETIAEARAAAPEASADWLLAELELCVIENLGDRANQVLEQIRIEHGDDPEVIRRLLESAEDLGIRIEAGRPAGDRPVAAPSAADQPVGAAAAVGGASDIWTPGGETGNAGEKKLWTPS